MPLPRRVKARLRRDLSPHPNPLPSREREIWSAVSSREREGVGFFTAFKNDWTGEIAASFSGRTRNDRVGKMQGIRQQAGLGDSCKMQVSSCKMQEARGVARRSGLAMAI